MSAQLHGPTHLLSAGESPRPCLVDSPAKRPAPASRGRHGLEAPPWFPPAVDEDVGACDQAPTWKLESSAYRPLRVSDRDQLDFDLTPHPTPRLSVVPQMGVASDTGCEYEVGGFCATRMGPDLALDTTNSRVKRVGQVGGSRLVLSEEGITAGQATWTVVIGHSRLSDSALASMQRMRKGHSRRHCGVRLGVCNNGANLRWFAGYDTLSTGLDSEGGVWQGGTKFQEQAMDRCSQTATFRPGDRVSVCVDAAAGLLRYKINDKPVPGVYYLKGFREGAPLFLAVSLLWPGEEVTMLDEEIYDDE